MTKATKFIKHIKLALFMVLISFSQPTAVKAEPLITDKNTAHDFSFTDIDGSAFKLDQFKGRVIMIVNTASECGFTDQFKDLQTLYTEYEPRGLVIIAIPSNDFGGQEPLNGQDIKKFCTSHYNISFPIMEKISVKGETAHAFYQWAATQPTGTTPKWNFHKFIINQEGHLVGSFGSMTTPQSEKITTLLETLLPTSG